MCGNQDLQKRCINSERGIISHCLAEAKDVVGVPGHLSRGQHHVQFEVAKQQLLLVSLLIILFNLCSLKFQVGIWLVFLSVRAQGSFLHTEAYAWILWARACRFLLQTSRVLPPAGLAPHVPAMVATFLALKSNNNWDHNPALPRIAFGPISGTSSPQILADSWTTCVSTPRPPLSECRSSTHGHLIHLDCVFAFSASQTWFIDVHST